MSGLARGFKFLSGYEETISLTGESLSRRNLPECTGFPISIHKLPSTTSKKQPRELVITQTIARDLTIKTLFPQYQLASIKFKQVTTVGHDIIAIRDMTDNVVIIKLNVC